MLWWSALWSKWYFAIQITADVRSERSGLGSGTTKRSLDEAGLNSTSTDKHQRLMKHYSEVMARETQSSSHSSRPRHWWNICTCTSLWWMYYNTWLLNLIASVLNCSLFIMSGILHFWNVCICWQPKQHWNPHKLPSPLLPYIGPCLKYNNDCVV